MSKNRKPTKPAVETAEYSDADNAPIYEPCRDPVSDGLHELTDEEARQRLTSDRGRPGWMPKGCAYTPTRYLCVCFYHDARAAVENATNDVQWPTAMRDIRFEDGTPNGATIGQLFARMLDELDFQSKNETYSGRVNTTDLLYAFAYFMEAANTYLLKRHCGAKRMDDAINAVEECVNLTEEHIPSIQAVRPTADLAVTPEKFRERVTRMLELDAEREDVQSKDFAEDLDPERNQKDAITFCARVVLYAWTQLNKTKRTASDYVFIGAKEGDRIFAACKRARTYQQCYNFKPSSVETQAGLLHAAETNYIRQDGIKRPESMHQAAIRSRQEEKKNLKTQKRKRSGNNRK